MSQEELSRAEIARYARHLLLDEVGMEGQQRLKASSVLCVGSGGLGSPLLMYLAAAGVGRIGVVDADRVEVSNLQRQILHGSSGLGQLKVASATRRLQDLNPHVSLEAHAERLTSESALRLIAPYDVVVDGSDNFPTRYLINDAASILGKPWVHGSIFRFEGQVSVFNFEGGPDYRDLYPQPPPPGSIPSCAEGGVLGVLPGVIGSIQATEVLKILIGRGETLSGRLLLYDALRMEFSELGLPKRADRAPITELVDYQLFCGLSAESSEEPLGAESLSVQEAHRRMQSGWSPYLLDVRRPAEAAVVQLPGTDRLLPHLEVAAAAGELPADRDILVYCKAGKRSIQACRALAAAGLPEERLFQLEGGILAWAKEIDPQLPRY